MTTIGKKRLGVRGHAVPRKAPQRLPTPDLGPMTFEEFITTDFENPHVEWVGGRAVEMAPISTQHQLLGTWLLSLLAMFADERKLGLVLCEPLQMKLQDESASRAPDVMFIANAHRKRLKKTYLSGPADLVVEIISPGSRGIDRGEKFYEYEAGGVPECWLIDPERKQAEFYLLNSRRIYQLAELDADGIFHSPGLRGVWINPAWFWQKPLPPALSILRQWKLI